MHQLFVQAVRFAGVGGLATAVHVTVAYALSGPGMPALLANLGGFLCAFPVSYLGNFYWTFGCHDGHGLRVRRFAVAAAIGFGLSNAIVLTTVDGLGLSFEVALAGIVACVPALNFAVAKLWVYDRRAEAHVGDA